MDIVLVHSADPYAPVQGGAVRYMLGLLAFLRSHGHRVTFIGTQKNQQSEGRSDSGLTSIPIGPSHWLLYSLKLALKTPWISLPADAIIQTGRLDWMVPFVLFKPSNPKVMISDEPLATYARLKFGRVFGLVAFIYHLVESYCLRRIDFLVTDERTAETYFLRRYPWLRDEKLLIMSHSPVDLDVFKPVDKQLARERFGFSKHDRIILFLGRIAPVKRIDYIIRAFDLVRQECPEAKLVITGRGHRNDEIRLNQLVQELDLENVVFTGEVHPHRVSQIIGCADVLALSSRVESGPIVVKEALACGVPVVSTDVGEVRNLVTDDLLGRVVTGSESEFAQAAVRGSDERAAVADELADVIIYCLSLSNALDLDVSSAVLGKLQTNEHRYPADEFRIPPQVGRFRRPEREKEERS